MLLNQTLEKAYIKCYNEISNNQELLQDMKDYQELLDHILPEPTPEEFREYLFYKYDNSMIQRVITAFTSEYENKGILSFQTYLKYLYLTPGAETQTAYAYYLHKKKELEKEEK